MKKHIIEVYRRDNKYYILRKEGESEIFKEHILNLINGIIYINTLEENKPYQEVGEIIIRELNKLMNKKINYVNIPQIANSYCKNKYR